MDDLIEVDDRFLAGWGASPASVEWVNTWRRAASDIAFFLQCSREAKAPASAVYALERAKALFLILNAAMAQFPAFVLTGKEDMARQIEETERSHRAAGHYLAAAIGLRHG